MENNNLNNQTEETVVENTQVEETTVENTTVKNTTETYAEDNAQADAELFALLDKVLEKRSTGIAKSALKDNGMADDEISEVISRYRASKQTAKTKEAETLAELQKRNEELTKKLFDIDLNNAAVKAATKIGMNSEKLKHAMKLADLNKAVKDGKIDEAAVESALADVLKDIPEFAIKQGVEGPVVRKVGVADKEPDKKNPFAALNKAFGLPEDE